MIKIHALLIFFFSFFMTVAFSVHAGGGQWHPVNFQHGEVIHQSSFEFIVQMNDYRDGNFYPIVGKDFEFVAHKDLNGAYCTTTQRTSDSNGHVKARCGTATYGRFVFDVKPADGSPGPQFEVYLGSTGETVLSPKLSVKPSSTTAIKPSASPKSSPTIIVTPSPSPEPSPVIEASAEPSPTPIPEPVAESPKGVKRFFSAVGSVWRSFLSLFSRD
ncbi:MAG TPA: hypothetical protein VF209_01590 [Patescibacteria group bacterium]